MSWLLRSPDNVNTMREQHGLLAVVRDKMIAEGKTEHAKALEYQFASTWEGAKPGDVVVSRDFRAVYLIDTDGSRRRVDDQAAVDAAVGQVKGLIEEIVKKRQQA